MDIPKGNLRASFGFSSGCVSQYYLINISNWSLKPRLQMLLLSIHCKTSHNKVISVPHFNIFQQGVEETETDVGHRC